MRRTWGIALAVIGAAAAHGATTTWSPADVATIRSLWIGSLGPTPADPSNRVADNAAAAALGRTLFSDARFSRNRQVSCASCHQPSHGFTDARSVGRGVLTGTRRTMPIAQAVYSPWQFWDGRADSLWSQALGPVENPREHGSTRTQVARVLERNYRLSYERLFGAYPDISDRRRFPPRASPNGDRHARAAWATMAIADQHDINLIYANFGKSIAAFERTLTLRPTRFDRFVTGLVGEAPAAPLSNAETSGLRLFLGKGRCTLCHSGPMLSNEGFANTGVPQRSGLSADVGRIRGARIALADPFNCKGAYSDAAGQGCDELAFIVEGDRRQTRAYKVPSLRGVGQRAPYMHAGQFGSLERVIDHYDRAPRALRGTSELKRLRLTGRERRELLAFLRTLDVPRLPSVPEGLPF